VVVEVTLLDVVNTEDEAVDVAIWRRMSRGCGKTVVMQGYKGAFKKLLLDHQFMTDIESDGCLETFDSAMREVLIRVTSRSFTLSFRGPI